MSLTNLARTKAGKLLDDFLNDRASLASREPDVKYTDDIGDCQPLRMLLDAIVDGSNEIQASFPFTLYKRFDEEKEIHSFRMLHVYKQVDHLGPDIQKYGPLFTLARSLRSPEAILDAAIKSGLEPKGMQDAAPALSDALKWVQAQMRLQYGVLEKVDKSGTVKKMIENSGELGKVIESVRTEETSGGLSIENKPVMSAPDDSSLNALIKTTIDTGKILGIAPTESYSGVVMINQGFPRYAGGSPHTGIDIACGKGHKVFSITDGEITDIVTGMPSKRERGAPTNKVVVKSGSYQIKYCHVDSTGTGLKKGDKITAGTVLGIPDLSGNCDGYHLHFEVRKKGISSPVDPVEYLLEYHPRLRFAFSAAAYLPGEYQSKSYWESKMRERMVTTVARKIVPQRPSAVAVKTKVVNFTDNLSAAMDKILISCYSQALGSIYKTLSYDLTGEIERMSITAKPGTSVNIPLEGEEAPVVQSTGGRVVQIQIHTKAMDAVDIARFSTMFKVVGREDTIASMLMQARSVFRGQGESRQRIKYLLSYYEQEQLKKLLENLEGRNLDARFDEPVRIENDLLNSIGLDTFVPSNLEIQTDDRIAGAYNMILTLNYVNLGVRSSMSLRLEKGGVRVPFLPVACRVGQTVSSFSQNQTLVTDEDSIYVMRHIANAAVEQGIPELLLLYTVSRLGLFASKIQKWITKTKGQGLPLEISDANFGEFLGFGHREDLDTLAERMYRDQEAALLRELGSDTVKASRNRFTGNVTDQAVSFSALLSAIFMNSAIAGGVRWKYGNIAAGIVGIIGASTTFLSIYANSAVDYDNPFSTQGEKVIYFNLMSLMPHMLLDLMREYAYAFLRDECDEFILSVAEQAMVFLADSKVITNDGRGVQGYQFSDRLILKRDGKETPVSGIVMSSYTNLSHFKQEAGVIIPWIRGIEESTKISYASNLEGEKKKIKSSLEQFKRIPQNAGDLQKFSAEILLYKAVEAMLVSDRLEQIFGNKDTLFLGSVSRTASYLARNASGRKHAKELIAALFTQSFLDWQAAEAITSGTYFSYDRVLEQALKTVRADSYVMPEEEQKLALKYTQNLQSQCEEATSAIRRNGISPQLLAGYFVEDSMDTNIRRGFAHVLIGILESVDQACSQGTAGIPSGTGMRSEVSLASSTMRLASMVEGSLFERVGDAYIHYLVKTGLCMYTMAVDLLVYAVRKAAWGPLAKLATLLDIIIFAGFVTEALAGKASTELIKYLSGFGNLFVLSQWIASEIRDGLDVSRMLMMCFLSDIWLPSVLEANQDVSDKRQTSYLDYPTVTRGNKALPPDFYIYKIGLIAKGFQEMKDLIGTVGGIVEDRYVENEHLDYNQLMKTLGDRTNGMLSSSVSNYEIQLQSILFGDSLGASKISQALFYDKATRSYNLPRYVEIGRYINTIFFGQESDPGNARFVIFRYMDGAGRYTYMRHGGPGTAAADSSSLSSAMLVVTIFMSDGKPQVTIRSTEGFTSVIETSLGGTSYATMTSSSGPATIMERAVLLNLKDVVNQEKQLQMQNMLIQSTTLLANFAAMVRQTERGIIERVNKTMPHTLGNLMLAHSLVGSGMHAIGRPGLTMFKNELATIGTESLRRALAFRSGYLFPTVKLFILEEDNDAWYLYDDLYSYSFISSLVVHMDAESPVQTAMLKIVNLYGNLTNVLADRVNMEMNFLKAPDEQTPINAIMLKVGCKIKIMAGNTPYLTERDTLFTGRVTEIMPGPVLSVEARSGGDCLLEEVSKNKPLIIGDAAALSAKFVNRAMALTARWIKRSIAGASIDYLRPIVRLRQMITNLMNKVVQVSGQLSEFMVAPITGQSDDGLKASYDEFFEFMRAKLVERYSARAFESMGASGLRFTANDQLMENVRISGDRYWDPGASVEDMGAWLSFNETAWDVANEMNLLLPNNVLTVRPFDTRSTLVWGEEDGYYRMRRGSDLHCMIADQLIDKLDKMSQSNLGTMQPVWNAIYNNLTSNDSSQMAAGFALMTVISYYAQKLMYAMGYDTNYSDLLKRTIDLDESGIPKSIAFLLGLKPGSAIDNAMQMLKEKLDYWVAVLGGMYILIGQVYAATEGQSKFDGAEVSQVTMSQIGQQLKTIITDLSEKDAQGSSVALACCVYLASEMVVKYCLKTAQSSSGSFRRISDYHIKMSGRDIVKNELIVTRPYNAVRLTYPGFSVDNADIILGGPEEGLSGESDNFPQHLHQVHYQLKPWAKREYQAYFKNVNAFRLCRTSAISMAGASILTRLLKDTYGGALTLLGDTRIRENDKIFLWDENRDMYGAVKVKKHTFLFTPEEGCLSVIEPGMMTRNSYYLKSTLWDKVSNLASFAAGAAVATVLFVSAWKAGRKLSMKLIQKAAETKSPLMQGLGKAATFFAKYDEAMLPGLRLAGVTPARMAEAVERVPEMVKGIGVEHIKLRSSLEKIILEAHHADKSVSYASRIQGIIEEHLKRLSCERFAPSANQLESDIANAIREAIIQKRTNRSLVLDEEFLKIMEKKTDDMVLTARGHGMAGDSIFLRTNTGESIGKRVRKALEDPLVSEDGKQTIDRMEKTYAETAENISKIRNAESGAVKHSDYKDVADYIENSIYATKGSILKSMLFAAEFVMGYQAVGWAAGGVQAFGEMILTDTDSADNIILAPLFFRGEPMVAGLEGMVKKEAEDVSTMDLIKSRFTGIKDAIGYATMDPIVNEFYKLSLEYYRTKREVDGKAPVLSPYTEEP